MGYVIISAEEAWIREVRAEKEQKISKNELISEGQRTVMGGFNMGFFVSDPLDFDGDGKRSIDEDFMEYQAFKSWLDETEGDDDEDEMYESAAKKLKYLYEKNGLPEDFAPITTMEGLRKKFCKLFSPNQLIKYSGHDIWAKLWNTSDDGMINCLRNKAEYRGFGSAQSQDVKGLPMCYLKKDGWGSFYEEGPLAYQKALQYGEKFRNKLVNCTKKIEKMQLETADDYEKLGKFLAENLDGRSEHLWLHKYLHMIYPDKFSQFHTAEWKRNVLCILGVNPLDSYYGMEGQLAVLNKISGINNFYLFANVIYKSFSGIGMDKVCLITPTEEGLNVIKKWHPDTLVDVKADDFLSLYKNSCYQEKTPSERGKKKEHFFVVEYNGSLLGIIRPLADKKTNNNVDVRVGRWNACFGDGDKLPYSDKQPKGKDNEITDFKQLNLIFNRYYNIQTVKNALESYIEKHISEYGDDYAVISEKVTQFKEYYGNNSKLISTFKQEGIEKFRKCLVEELHIADGIRDISVDDYPESIDTLGDVAQLIATGDPIYVKTIAEKAALKVLSVYYPKAYLGIDELDIIDIIVEELGIPSISSQSVTVKNKLLIKWIHEHIDFADDDPARANYCFIRAIYDYLNLDFFAQENDKKNSYKDYSDGKIKITKEQWLKLLNNEVVFDEDSKRLLARIYARPEHASTASDIAEEENRTLTSCNSVVFNLGSRALKELGLSEYGKQDDERKEWLVPFLGKQEDANHFSWKIRPELEEAMEESLQSEIKDAQDDYSIKYDDLKQLREKAEKAGTVEVVTKQVSVEQRSRNKLVSGFARRVAKGTCQLCGLSAPFTDNKGEPYLEVHHIVWLANGGSDSIDNAIALCPNCHRKMHVVNDSDDVEYLLGKAKEIANY